MGEAAAFVWVPGRGCEVRALRRIRRAYRDPPELFDGEDLIYRHVARRLGPYVTGADKADRQERRRLRPRDADAAGAEISTYDLEGLFEELASCRACFGHRPLAAEWFRHLLGIGVPRSHEVGWSCLSEALITLCIAEYPDRIDPEPYKGFAADVMNTLGRVIMDASCWSDGRIILGQILHRYRRRGSQLWGWRDASGEFSASMFFCLKYLALEQIDPWLRSVFAIQCPYWRAQLLVWLIAARDVLLGQIQPRRFDESGLPPTIGWWGTWLLSDNYSGRMTADVERSAFIPAPNGERALEVIRCCITAVLFEAWLTAIAEIDDLRIELADLPERFRAIYL